MLEPCGPPPSAATGVRHRCAAVPRAAGERIWLEPEFGASGAVVGVGQDEDPLPKMGGSDSGRRETVPLRMEPELGQISQNLPKASSPVNSKQTWDVLQEDDAGSKLAKYPRDSGP